MDIKDHPEEMQRLQQICTKLQRVYNLDVVCADVADDFAAAENQGLIWLRETSDILSGLADGDPTVGYYLRKAMALFDFINATAFFAAESLKDWKLVLLRSALVATSEEKKMVMWEIAHAYACTIVTSTSSAKVWIFRDREGLLLDFDDEDSCTVAIEMANSQQIDSYRICPSIYNLIESYS